MRSIQRPRFLFHHSPLGSKFVSFTQFYRPFSSSSSSPSLLDLCNSLHQVQQAHTRFILHGLHQNSIISSKLVEAYANLGLFNLSRQVFDSIIDPNPTLYNTFFRNLYKFGKFEKALLVFQEMIRKSLYPDEDTYPLLLRSCLELLDIENGKGVHGQLLKIGLDSFELVESALVEMYGEFDNFSNAHNLVEKKPVRDVNYWNSLIFEAFQNGDTEGSFRGFMMMKMERVVPNSVTVINLLRCVDMSSLKLGKCLHCMAIVYNLCGDLAANTALLTMYSKLVSLEDARLLFEKMPEKDCVVWNLLMSAYSRGGFAMESLELLKQMMRSRIRADMFTVLAAISSIAELKSVKLGKEIHANVIRNGSDYQVSVHNSLIDMYCKCDCLTASRKIFDLLTNKTVISWSSMIKGYAAQEQFYGALTLFTKMKWEGFVVDCVTVINILPACVNIGALEQVQYLHGCSIKYGLTSIPSVNTAFLASYAKCGCIEMARRLFDDKEIDNKDIVTWNSMINSYSKHGDWSRCFELYYQMKESKLRPDGVTFLGLLTACVNSGSVEEGRQYFKEMTEKYSFQPHQEHYACMVDLLGRSGRIKETLELIRSMPFKPDARVWGPLLSACKMHAEPKLAEFAAEKLISMEPKNAGNYILLSNIYAAAGKWDGVAKMRIFLRDKGLKKTPGCSWMEINGKVHEFRVADQSHPQSNEIYIALNNLESEIKELKHCIF